MEGALSTLTQSPGERRPSGRRPAPGPSDARYLVNLVPELLRRLLGFWREETPLQPRPAEGPGSPGRRAAYLSSPRCGWAPSPGSRLREW